MNSDNDSLWREIVLHPWAAGLWGAVVGVRYIPGETLPAKAWSLVGGVASVIYAAPWVAEQLLPPTPNAERLCSFAVGLFAMNVIGKSMDILRGVGWSDVRALLPWGSRRDGE